MERSLRESAPFAPDACLRVDFDQQWRASHAPRSLAADGQPGFIKWGIDTGNQKMLVSLGNKLLDMPIFKGAHSYPAGTPSKGRSAPWER